MYHHFIVKCVFIGYYIATTPTIAAFSPIGWKLPSSPYRNVISSPVVIITTATRPCRSMLVVQRNLSTENEDTDESTTSTATTTTPNQMSGCRITRNPDSLTTFTIQIDGVEADLGQFSLAIYRKITSDAKRERFQGFRPGTIPPHLLPTYKAFAMDEAAREAVLEAMEQNQIRPFDTVREEMMLEDVSIPPPTKKKSKKKKKKKRKPQTTMTTTEENETQQMEEEKEETIAWLTFKTMDEALKAGWEPGQSFSFVAKNVKGQEAKAGSAVGSTKIGAAGGAIDLNQIAADAAAADASKSKE